MVNYIALSTLTHGKLTNFWISYMTTLKLSDHFEAYYYGLEGETLFHKPYPTKLGIIADNPLGPIVARDRNLDDRSLALVSAMISENYIDPMLKLLLPSFTLERQGSASMKINLLTRCLQHHSKAPDDSGASGKSDP